MTKKSAQIAFDDVLRQVTEGNEEAFQQLYLHYHDRLFQFARMYLHQQQAAEDVVADLFFQLWKSRGMLGGIENFNAYIYRAVRNSCTNYLLSGYRNRMSGFTQVQLQVSIDPAVPADEADDVQLQNSALTDAAPRTLPHHLQAGQVGRHEPPGDRRGTRHLPKHRRRTAGHRHAPSEGRRSPFPEKNLKKSQIGLVVSQVRLVLFVNGQ